MIQTTRSHDVSIIDMYNVFCSVVKFKKSDKTKQFTEAAFVSTFEAIAKCTQVKHHYLVSKDIFEVPKATIKRLTKAHSNITYIVVNDLLASSKGDNRSRDDFFVFYLSKTLPGKVKSLVVVSRDKYTDFHQIVKRTQPIEVVTYKNGVEKTIKMDAGKLERAKLVFKNKHKPNAVGFSIRK